MPKSKLFLTKLFRTVQLLLNGKAGVINWLGLVREVILFQKNIKRLIAVKETVFPKRYAVFLCYEFKLTHYYFIDRVIKSVSLLVPDVPAR